MKKIKKKQVNAKPAKYKYVSSKEFQKIAKFFENLGIDYSQGVNSQKNLQNPSESPSILVSDGLSYSISNSSN